MASSDKHLIPDRVLLMGEQRIPHEVIERLSDIHLKLFLREPNPYLWPEEMRHLKDYLPAQEVLHWEVWHALRDHKGPVKDFLGRWCKAALSELKGRESLRDTAQETLLEGIKEYIGEVLRELLEELEGK